MRFMAESTRVEIALPPLVHDGEPSFYYTRFQVEKWCQDNLAEKFLVLISREDRITDDLMWLALYCEDPADAERVTMNYGEA